MTLNFPSLPDDGDVYENYVYDAATGVWNANPYQIAARFVTSSTAPANPSEGDGWFDTTSAKSYTYYDGVWVQLGGLGTVDLNQISDIDINNPTNGQALTYSDGEWVNSTPATPPSSISDLSDTEIYEPVDGEALLYNSSTNKWVNSAINLTDPIKLNEQTITENYTIPAGYNGLSAGPITISEGVTVTIPDGSAWSIV